MVSRLDGGTFTAGEIQTMARVINLPVEQIRRITELAVFLSGLDHPEHHVEPVSASPSAYHEPKEGADDAS